MVVGVLTEAEPEQRVALLPEAVKALQGLQVSDIRVEKGAGTRAGFSDKWYKEAGATIADRASIIANADLLLSINPISQAEFANAKKDQVQVAAYNALSDPDLIEFLRKQPLTTFSMDLVPRTTRAQSMDILSSQATVAGYKAVLMAANRMPKFLPMFTTAAGSIPPGKVLILGAGVAGLQAIATARRLGAVVEAFDVRSAVREEVKSLGAKFVEVEGASEDKAAGGYAVEQTEEYKQKQAMAIHEHAIKADVIITTAQIPGRTAPRLIHEETVEAMKDGSVIIDLAAGSGGNVANSKPDEEVHSHGVTILGPTNLPSTLPMDASKMFGKNVLNFLKLIIKEGELNLNWEDNIVDQTCLTHGGEVRNERAKTILQPQS